MANPCPNPPPIATRFANGHAPINGTLTANPKSQALALQKLILERAADKKCTDSALASLARSWCLVQEAKRIIDGRPLPGQLRPELDPSQFAKLAKRHRQRMLYDVQSSVSPTSFEDRTQPTEPTTKQSEATEPPAPKE